MASEIETYEVVPLVGPQRPLPRTKQQLREAYGVSKRTFERWLSPLYAELEKIGCNRACHQLTPRAVVIIFRHLAPPEGYR